MYYGFILEDIIVEADEICQMTAKLFPDSWERGRRGTNLIRGGSFIAHRDLGGRYWYPPLGKSTGGFGIIFETPDNVKHYWSYPPGATEWNTTKPIKPFERRWPITPGSKIRLLYQGYNAFGDLSGVSRFYTGGAPLGLVQLDGKEIELTGHRYLRGAGVLGPFIVFVEDRGLYSYDIATKEIVLVWQMPLTLANSTRICFSDSCTRGVSIEKLGYFDFALELAETEGADGKTVFEVKYVSGEKKEEGRRYLGAMFRGEEPLFASFKLDSAVIESSTKVESTVVPKNITGYEDDNTAPGTQYASAWTSSYTTPSSSAESVVIGGGGARVHPYGDYLASRRTEAGGESFGSPGSSTYSKFPDPEPSTWYPWYRDPPDSSPPYPAKYTAGYGVETRDYPVFWPVTGLFAYQVYEYKLHPNYGTYETSTSGFGGSKSYTRTKDNYSPYFHLFGQDPVYYRYENNEHQYENDNRGGGSNWRRYTANRTKVESGSTPSTGAVTSDHINTTTYTLDGISVSYTIKVSDKFGTAGYIYTDVDKLSWLGSQLDMLDRGSFISLGLIMAGGVYNYENGGVTAFIVDAYETPTHTYTAVVKADKIPEPPGLRELMQANPKQASLKIGYI